MRKATTLTAHVEEYLAVHADMELSLRTTVPATVEGEGAVVMPAKLLGVVVRLLPAKEAAIAHRPEDGVASIESGSYSGRVIGRDASTIRTLRHRLSYATATFGDVELWRPRAACG